MQKYDIFNPAKPTEVITPLVECRVVLIDWNWHSLFYILLPLSENLSSFLYGENSSYGHVYFIVFYLMLFAASALFIPTSLQLSYCCHYYSYAIVLSLNCIVTFFHERENLICCVCIIMLRLGMSVPDYFRVQEFLIQIILFNEYRLDV